MAADSIEASRDPVATVHVDRREIGRATLDCFTVSNACALMPLALRDAIRAADRAILQTYLRLLDLPWGLIVNFEKRTLTHEYVIQPKS